MFSRNIAMVWFAALALVFSCAASRPAKAQYFSNHDGYTDSGGYRIQLEVSPYLWLIGTSGTVGYARQGVANRISGDFGTSIPSISSLANTLHFSFMGDSLLRYGPYSGELDLQYVNGSKSKDVASPPGAMNRINARASYVRLAPGLGYEVYSGDVYGVPVSADARAGFAYFAHWEGLKGEGDLSGSIGGSGDFIQPWFGGRLDFIPAPSWRIEFTALAQGLGVDGGSWGWGASAIGSYAFSGWFAVDGGFRALNTSRKDLGESNSGSRSLNLTAYGPVVGASFRF